MYVYNVYLHKEKVDLYRIVDINIIISKEQPLPQYKDLSLVYPLLTQRLIPIDPIHWREREGGREGEGGREAERERGCQNDLFS